jgi:hypothetical protein
VYNGTWKGSGEIFTSYNPATNEPIAQTRGGTVAEYEVPVRLRFPFLSVIQSSNHPNVQSY